jgi:hypothetical protein
MDSFTRNRISPESEGATLFHVGATEAGQELLKELGITAQKRPVVNPDGSSEVIEGEVVITHAALAAITTGQVVYSRNSNRPEREDNPTLQEAIAMIVKTGQIPARAGNARQAAQDEANDIYRQLFGKPQQEAPVFAAARRPRFGGM